MVGEGRGIRDLHPVKDGLLILAGPDDDSPKVDWIVALWDGKGAGGTGVKPNPRARLDLPGVKLRACDEELKPEALAVVEDAADKDRIVVMSAVMCNGGPLAFTIQR